MATANNGYDGRGERGHFAPGNKIAKGNIAYRRQAEFRKKFNDAIHPETITYLCRKLQKMALEGDLDAAKLLLSYTLGRPVQAIELTGADGGRLGPSFVAIQAVILDSLAGDSARQFELAAKLKSLADADD